MATLEEIMLGLKSQEEDDKKEGFSNLCWGKQVVVALEQTRISSLGQVSDSEIEWLRMASWPIAPTSLDFEENAVTTRIWEIARLS
jgi:hypothetical protein